MSKLSGYIIKGHGRYEAAKLAKFDLVPVDYQDYESREEELADMLADNRIAELSNLDKNLAFALVDELNKVNFDLDLTGFGLNDFKLDICAKVIVSAYFFYYSFFFFPLTPLRRKQEKNIHIISQYAVEVMGPSQHPSVTGRLQPKPRAWVKF